MISNFDPNLLQIKFTAISVGSMATAFRYSFVDAAIMKDPTPATYTIFWAEPLPANGLVARAILNGTVATIKWNTLSEQNTRHFIIERSFDNINFSATGNAVPAAGNSAGKRDYQMQDNIAELMQKKVIYYRVKLIDLDGKLKYSNVVVLKLSQKQNLQVTTWPNPFQSSVTVRINTENATTFQIKLVDVTGRLIRNIIKPVAKGESLIVIREFGQLPQGLYLLELIDEKSKATTVQKLIKN
jgi:hypothetical protein